MKSRSAAVHYSVNVPDALKSLSSIEKDVRRFPKAHGWAYAKFDYDSATDTFAPDADGAECVPYDGGGAGLHLHSVSKKVNAESSTNAPTCGALTTDAREWSR